jgi:segregation and condensation protein A
MEHRVIAAEINIEERIISIKNMVTEKIKINFSRILKESNSKVEIIVNFLAVLELAKQKELIFDQTDLFGEIFVERYKELNN